MPHARPSRDFLIALAAVLAAPVAAGALVWLQGTPQERDAWALLLEHHPSSVITTATLLLASLGFALRWVFVRYIEPMRTLVEEVELIGTANPGYRLSLGDQGDIARLAGVINAAAERLEQAQATLDERIKEANAGLEKERTSLAALIQWVSEGVLLCTGEGQIQLYNRRAKELLTAPPAARQTSAQTAAHVGLGRSVFPLIDRSLLLHALDNATQATQRDGPNAATAFVTAGGSGELLRVHLAAIRDQKGSVAGFVLLLNDITERAQLEAQREAILHALSEGLRQSLAPLRTAVETLEAFPAMDIDRQNRLVSIIRQETLSLSETFARTIRQEQELAHRHWRLEKIRGSVLLTSFKRRAEQTLDVDITVEEPETDLWLAVDAQALLQVFLHLTEEMKRATGLTAFRSRSLRRETFIAIDLIWKGPPVPPGTLAVWETHPIASGEPGVYPTIQEVLERHGATAWVEAAPGEAESFLRLLLPEAQALGSDALRWSVSASASGRPEFFDFDLFASAAGHADLEAAMLKDLTYTAFDTETTGLDPANGDEIISIGAVRIVNGRLLQGEIFNQLVDPRRPIAHESFLIHGIETHMVRGKPTIESVLPALYAFASGTVLVAHNGAFDMRFFQLKEKTTGVRFTAPVLDTLLLSAVVHPHQEDQSLEEIASRLGVPLTGRHTALGDAIITGEVFLKLLVLMKKRGIVTLGGALSASKKTFFSRIRY